MAINRLGNHYKREGKEIEINNYFDENNPHLPIFIDTNFLMALGAMKGFNLSYELERIFPEKHELIILTPIFNELTTLSVKSKPKVQQQAKLALRFVEIKCQILKPKYRHRYPDFVLLHYCEKYSGVLATNDKQLKQLAKKRGLQILYIRDKRYLELQ